MPASRPRWMMRMLSSWSGLPQAPNIIAPRQSFETETPVRPSMRCSMAAPVWVMGLAPARWPVARWSVGGRRGDAVLLVGHVPAPGDDLARVILLLHGQVGHETGRHGTVPVILAGLEVHPVTWSDELDLSALTLTQPEALSYEDRLAAGMRVPGGPGTRREVNQRRGEGGIACRRGDGVDVHVAGEPVA